MHDNKIYYDHTAPDSVSCMTKLAGYYHFFLLFHVIVVFKHTKKSTVTVGRHDTVILILSLSHHVMLAPKLTCPACMHPYIVIEGSITLGLF